jgi:Bacteriophage Mu, Gp27
MRQHMKRRVRADAEARKTSARRRARKTGAREPKAIAPAEPIRAQQSAPPQSGAGQGARKIDRRRYKIRNLPVEIRHELDTRLRDMSFQSYRSLSGWLAGKGCYISPSALHRYSRGFEARLEAVRLATAEAKAIVEETAGDDHAMAEALMHLVQTHLFKVLCTLMERSKGEDTPNIHAVARSVAGLAKAAVTQERWVEHTRARVNQAVGEAERSVDEARESGLSEEAAEKIRAALMDAKL